MDSLNNSLNILKEKLFYSRTRILSTNPFFGVILYDLSFFFTSEEKSISTDGKSIYINPSFLLPLSDKEIDIVISHELMHIILKHPFRYKKCYDNTLYHQACDIVVNSNLLSSSESEDKELIVQGRKLPHLAPNNKEGYFYSTEEVYQMLCNAYPHLLKKEQEEIDKGEEEQHDQENQESSDNVLIGDAPINTIKIGKILSSITSKCYLRTLSLGDYHSDNYPHFDDGPEYKLSWDMNKYTYSLLRKYKLVKEVISELSFTDIDEAPIPYYVSHYPYAKGSESSSIEGITNKIYSYISVDKSFNQNDINALIELASKEHIPNEYSKYRRFVYENYLSIDKDIEAYFDNINKTLGYTKGNINAITSIRNYIATSAIYDINHIDCPKGKDYILYFLKESKRGKCLHFASAAVMMYRYYGIPARLTLGYLVDTKKDDYMDIYKEQGHAWVEVFIDNVGWIKVDPTPIVARPNSSGSDSKGNKHSSKKNDNKHDSDFDSHNRWSTPNTKEGMPSEEDDIDRKMLEGESLSTSLNKGTLPRYAIEVIKELKNPTLDWRVLLNDFIQDEINDYSFNPPDRRFPYSDFILPDYNDKDYIPKDVVFMCDISGSMDRNEIRDCISEVKGAVDQFNGKLKGYVGLYDTEVERFIKLENFDNSFLVGVKGTGGNNEACIFEFLKNEFKNDLPEKVIILTDGYCEYPDEDIAKGMEVVWLINNKIAKAPWGKIIRKIDKE